MAGSEANEPVAFLNRERRLARECLAGLYRGRGGPYTREEARAILGDVLGLDDRAAHVHKLTARQCREMILRFIALGLA